MSAVPEDMCLLSSPSSVNAADTYVFGEETKDEITGSMMLRSVAALSPAVTPTLGSIQKRCMLYQTLSLVSEELVLPLQAGSSSRHSEAFDNQAAGMEIVQLADEATQGGYAIIEDEQDDHPVSIRSKEDAHHLRAESKEEEENLPLLPVSPSVESPVQEVAERPSMTSRLVGILRGVSNLTTAIRGTFLARHCSLSRSEENSDLQWGRTLGAGKYGRVTLVQHELGPFAVKELTEVGASLPLALRILLCHFVNTLLASPTVIFELPFRKVCIYCGGMRPARVGAVGTVRRSVPCSRCSREENAMAVISVPAVFFWLFSPLAAFFNFRKQRTTTVCTPSMRWKRS